MVEKRGINMKGYNQVSLPNAFYEEIKVFAQKNNFSSVADFVKTASREYMRKEVPE